MTPDNLTPATGPQADFTPGPPIDAFNVAVLKDERGTARFRCIGCSEDIVSYCHNGPPVCACCRAMPGWHRNPTLARVLCHRQGGGQC